MKNLLVLSSCLSLFCTGIANGQTASAAPENFSNGVMGLGDRGAVAYQKAIEHSAIAAKPWLLIALAFSTAMLLLDWLLRRSPEGYEGPNGFVIVKPPERRTSRRAPRKPRISTGSLKPLVRGFTPSH